MNLVDFQTRCVYSFVDMAKLRRSRESRFTRIAVGHALISVFLSSGSKKCKYNPRISKRLPAGIYIFVPGLKSHGYVRTGKYYNKGHP